MLTDLKTLLGDPISSDSKHDGLLEDILEGVLAAADDFVGASFQEVEDKEAMFDGGAKTIYLSHFNVTAVVLYSVEDYADVLVESDDYVLYPGDELLPAKILYKFGHFPRGRRNIKVVYDGGYGEDEYPASLRRKLLKQASYEFRRRSDPGLSSVGSPDGSVLKFSTGEWLPDVEEELTRRRRTFL